MFAPVGLAGAVRPQPGEWVLVEAAGGGVGSLLVQLAARAGSRVIAAAGGARKLDLAASVGAEVTVDYTAPGWEDRVRAATGGHGPDAVFDSVGGEIGRTALTLIRDGGRFCAMGAASGSMTVAPDGEVTQRRLRMIGLGDVLGTPEAVRDATSTALAEGAAGRLRPTIGQTFPLDRAPDAHAAIEARATIGKTLLLP
ncbi:MAG: zinc-binding dehydrogenase [bacterium]|nr:zinc-binding dehydrogenase [bacterium]